MVRYEEMSAAATGATGGGTQSACQEIPTPAFNAAPAASKATYSYDPDSEEEI